MRRAGVCLLVAPALLVGLTAPPSVAKAPAVTVQVASVQTSDGERVVLRGRVRVPVPAATLRVQTPRTGAKGAWRTVRTAQLTPKRRYAVRLARPAKTRKFRIAVVTARGRVAASRVVVVRGRPKADAVQANVRALVLEHTNTYRAANGLAPLAPLPAMHRVATAWSKVMASAGAITHNPEFAQQIPVGWTVAGENVAFGYPPHQVTAAWFASPGHRRNLLGAYTHIGIGYAVDGNGVPYYTQVFATYP